VCLLARLRGPLRPGRARERRLRAAGPARAVLASRRGPATALACRRGRGAGRRRALPDEAHSPSNPSTPRARTQVGEVVRGVGKVSLDVYNFLLKINGKYDLTDKAGAQLKDQLNKLKAGSSGETIAKVEDALSKATSKFNELDKEYDLVEKGKQALGYAGDLSAKAIDKGLELNAEYKLTDQVVAKVTEASSAAAAKATKKSA